MNIRELARFNQNYFNINREERNYAAIFFSAICNSSNLIKFLNYCKLNKNISNEFDIYFEYAFLRDLWYQINDDEIKKNIIRKTLNISNINNILKLPLCEINKIFGVGGEPSKKHLQFPGKWAIVKYNNNFLDNVDFLKICRFKWSFNIKPDIIIHLNKNEAICIEAKYESEEGHYPALNIEKQIFKDRDLEYVGQNELQKYMMENLLGIKTEFLYLVSKKEKSSTHRIVTWKEVFNCLDLDDMPNFAIKMIGKISK